MQGLAIVKGASVAPTNTQNSAPSYYTAATEWQTCCCIDKVAYIMQRDRVADMLLHRQSGIHKEGRQQQAVTPHTSHHELPNPCSGSEPQLSESRLSKGTLPNTSRSAPCSGASFGTIRGESKCGLNSSIIFASTLL